MRPIYADVAKEYFCAACSTHKKYQRTIEECRNHTDSYGNRCFKMRLLDNVPSVPLESLRPKGRWELATIKLLAAQYVRVGYCTNCNEERPVDNFCPNCGAKMEG